MAGIVVIRGGAQEIAKAADDLSMRTERQASSLEETSAAVEQIAGTVKTAADGAAHAQAAVAAADEDAKKSAGVVGEAVEALDAIAQSARQINQIVGVIDDIAFRPICWRSTPASKPRAPARRGAASPVVAAEVRGLSQRSAEAAKEIKALIAKSARHVGRGVKQVGETGRALERLLEQVAEINAVVADIAAGAKEQASGLAEVNVAIAQIDGMTQRNATMVGEFDRGDPPAVARDRQLSELVGRFRLSAGDGFRARARAPPEASSNAGRQVSRRPPP